MSIQSTTYLSREEAESRAINVLFEQKYKKIIRAEIAMMDDDELEDILESTFDNYSIKYFIT